MASDSNTLKAYVAQINDAAHVLDSFSPTSGGSDIQSNRGAEHEQLLPVDLPPNVVEALQTLIDAATRLLQIVSEPTQFIPHLSAQAQQISGLRWLCRFNVVSLVPPDALISYHDLAVAAKVPLKQLKTVVRILMCAGFFIETAAQEVKHTKLSAAFAQSEPLQTWAVFLAEDSVRLGQKLYEATCKWGETTSKTQTSFNLAFDTDKSYFEWLSSSTEATRRFAGYMQAVSATQGTAIKHLWAGYNWTQFDSATLVDVGGSTGQASCALAAKYKTMRCVVQDLPRVIEGVDKASLDADIRDRIEFQAHDFFTAQPVRDADVYLLRQILHDWPDADAAAILRQISTVATKPDARILIMDTVLPAPGSVGVTQEAQLRVRDMTMMQTFNACEREVDDWKALVKMADERLELRSICIPTGSNLGIMEVCFK